MTVPAFPGKKLGFGNKSDGFVAKRRAGLEAYLVGLLRVVGIRSNAAFRAAMELDSKSPDTVVTANAKESWLALYRALVGGCDEMASLLGQMRTASAKGQDTERLNTNLRVRINRLAEGIATLRTELDSGNLSITGREAMRRKDLLSQLTIRKAEMIEELQSVRASAGVGGAPPTSGAAGRSALFAGASSSRKPPPTKWGVAGETEETVDLDNRDLINLQKKIMENQDQGLDQLSDIMARQIQLANAIGQEVDHQNLMLDHLNDHVESTQASIDRENKNIIKLKRKI